MLAVRTFYILNKRISHLERTIRQQTINNNKLADDNRELRDQCVAMRARCARKRRESVDVVSFMRRVGFVVASVLCVVRMLHMTYADVEYILAVMLSLYGGGGGGGYGGGEGGGFVNSTLLNTNLTASGERFMKYNAIQKAPCQVS